LVCRIILFTKNICQLGNVERKRSRDQRKINPNGRKTFTVHVDFDGAKCITWNNVVGLLWNWLLNQPRLMNVKLGLVVLVLAYHIYCYKILGTIKNNKSQYSHIWFRWFNEVPVVLMVFIVALVVNKPTDLNEFIQNLLGTLLLVVVAFLLINRLVKKYKSKI